MHEVDRRHYQRLGFSVTVPFRHPFPESRRQGNTAQEDTQMKMKLLPWRLESHVQDREGILRVRGRRLTAA